MGLAPGQAAGVPLGFRLSPPAQTVLALADLMLMTSPHSPRQIIKRGHKYFKQTLTHVPRHQSSCQPDFAAKRQSSRQSSRALWVPRGSRDSPHRPRGGHGSGSKNQHHSQ